MDPAGFGIQTLDICIRYGRKLYEICQTYRSADREIREIVLRIESIWLKTQSQVEALRNLWNDLDGRVQIHHNHVLTLLYEKLHHVITIVSSLDTSTSEKPVVEDLLANTKGDLRKVKYAVFTKKKLEGAAADLEQWHTRFDPSWYLLTRVATPSMDEQLDSEKSYRRKELYIIKELRDAQRRNGSTDIQSSLFLNPRASDDDCWVEKRRTIPNTCAETGIATKKGNVVIVDPFHIQSGIDIQVVTRDVRNIGRTLAKVDPKVFGLLRCQGISKVFERSQVTGFEFLFKVPSGLTKPQSLRTFLLDNHNYPLDDRFRLARLLARSISFLHTAEIVHKNISPETILLFEDTEDHLHVPFLVGFEKFRHVMRATVLEGDEYWERNLYRHPARQGRLPEDVYKMQHDIYSLGVCLLEIGLGTSFVHFVKQVEGRVEGQKRKVAVPGHTLKESSRSDEPAFQEASASHKKARLISIAETQLSSRMGKVYTNVVLSCLQCLDRGNQGFGDESEFTDEDGLVVGVRYIEKVLYFLEEIIF